MGKLINHHSAKEYLDQINDPIVRALIEHAYSQIVLENLPEPVADFDLLFLYRVLECLLRDRKALARALTGELREHPLMGD
jgi:hypothetical protein